jgi:hypothetical protein
MPSMRPRSALIVALGVSQTLAWASSYYLPAILADPIRSTGAVGGAKLMVSRVPL